MPQVLDVMDRTVEFQASGEVLITYVGTAGYTLKVVAPDGTKIVTGITFSEDTVCRVAVPQGQVLELVGSGGGKAWVEPIIREYTEKLA